ncbi:Potassium efflux system KefA protein / Small-conductance mechanosensitive channel [hydrothermal vent metagenome]|uniref:Potassium efflux system KefA protein / Small-conductance mechanosensitive channel n=1 Tax=hydrothermal vent metagenome TaxID=652676 RepID=A0A3B0XEX6_9ZZZZ
MKKILNTGLLLALLLVSALAYCAEPEAPTVKELVEKKETQKEVLKELAEEPSEGPYDEFNRSTPRSSLLALGVAIKEKDYERAVNYLDLRNLPFAVAESEKSLNGPELVRKISIVARRAMTFDLENLSDDPAGAKNDGLPSYRDRIATVETKDGKTIDILMQRIPRKDGVYIWKLSNATVAKIPQLYEEFGYGVVGEKLSKIFPSYVIVGFEIWQLVMLISLILIGYFIAYSSTFVLTKVVQISKRFNQQRLQKFIMGPLRFLIVVIFVRFMFETISPSIIARAFYSANTFLIIAVLWVMLGAVDFIMYRLASRMNKNGPNSAIVLLKPVSTTIKILIVSFGIISWMDNLGFQVTALIAGLGVGGLAVALAAQKSLENLIGSIIIYTSQPVRVGDFCKFGNTVGTVEEIGLRATQLRTLARTVVHIPNALFASGEIENLTRRDKILYRTRLRLSYKNTATQIRSVLAKVRELIDSHEFIDEENSRVRFLEFGEYAQELELYVYIKTRDFSKFLEYREDINLKIIDIVEAVGVELIVPVKNINLHQSADMLGDSEKQKK